MLEPPDPILLCANCSKKEEDEIASIKKPSIPYIPYAPGRCHVVVGQVKDDYSIEMVHDPHPDGTGLRKITNYYFFVCKDPSKGKQ